MNKKTDLTPVRIDPQSVAELLYGMQQLCAGMNESVFGWNVSHYTTERDGMTAEENAHEFTTVNFDAIAGAFRMMGAATDIITTALSNGDLDIVPGEGAACNV